MALVLGSLLVGIGEELVFRGVSVNVMRDTGMPEVEVALWSSLLFGGVHVTNIVTEGPGAFFQVLVVSLSGFFFYLILRVSGRLMVPMAIHALRDFSIFSSNIGPDPVATPLVGLAMLTNMIIGLILLARRHKIGVADPAETDPPATQPA